MSFSDVQNLSSNQAHRAPRRRAITLVKWTLSIAMLTFVLYHANFRDVLESLRGVDFRWLLFAACLQPIGALITASRWRLLLKSQGVQVRLWHLFRSCMAANFFKQFMPSTIGGDAVRVHDSWRAGASMSVAISTLVVDRVLGLAVLAALVAVALALLGEAMIDLPLLPLWVALICSGLVLAVWAVFAPPSGMLRLANAIADRLPGPLSRLYAKIVGSTQRFRGQHRLLAISLALSVVLQLNIVLFYYMISRAMGFEIAFVMYFVIVPLATFVMLLPISINGIGVREGVFAVLLVGAATGVSSADAVAYAWLEYGVFLVMGVVGGLLYMLTRGPHRATTADHAPARVDEVELLHRPDPPPKAAS